jgi:preprotein translocase SecE subunit
LTVARDRQRAKQRRARRQQQNPGPQPSELHRENVPGGLEHLGEEDVFEADLIAGADGEIAEEDAAAEAELERQAEEEVGDLDDDGVVDEDDRALARTGGRRDAHQVDRPKGPRFWNFLKACWAELQRVQWPDRRQVGQATAVVLGFVVVAGAYLGVADKLAQELVDLII